MIASPARAARSASSSCAVGQLEIGEHAVAQELADVPAEARYLAGGGVLVGAEDIAHLLGVEARGKPGRADEVAEQDGELPALRLRRSAPTGGLRFRGGVGSPVRRGFEGGDGVQEPAPMADNGDAEVPEVIGREARQELGVNLVGVERLCIALQPQVPEPGRAVSRQVV